MELYLQKEYLKGQSLETVYFGGGTPSLLTVAELNSIMDIIHKHHSLQGDAEITLEANPDDLDLKKITELKGSPINRLSIGIQSFYDEDLNWMNRAHRAEEAQSALMNALHHGFENLTVDLIYGYPLLSHEKWNKNLQKVIDLGIPHISAYSMTVEARTALNHQITKGQSAPMDEEQSERQFIFLMETLSANGYEHYEISNFAKDKRYARHNSNYWKGIPYLGIGPSAHSYNGTHRSWNIANNSKYIASIKEKKLPQEQETLTSTNRLNEYIMTSLRTIWGIDFTYILGTFGAEHLHQLQSNAQQHLKSGHLYLHEDKLFLSQKGKLLADRIAADLFF